MPIMGFILLLFVLCGLAWVVSELLPMDPRLKRGLLIVIGFFIFFVVVVFMLQLVGVDTGTYYRVR